MDGQKEDDRVIQIIQNSSDGRCDVWTVISPQNEPNLGGTPNFQKLDSVLVYHKLKIIERERMKSIAIWSPSELNLNQEISPFKGTMVTNFLLSICRVEGELKSDLYDIKFTL